MDAEKDQDNPKKKKAIIGIVIGVVVALILIFVVLIVLFFFYFKPTQYHNIYINNGSKNPIILVFGAINEKGAEQFLKTETISPNGNAKYFATPGTTVIIEAYPQGGTVSQTVNPFTRAIIAFAGFGYRFIPNISNGKQIISNLQKNTDNEDRYGVSVQKGYNLTIGLGPNGNFTKSTDPYTCSAVTWNTNNPIDEDSCPQELRGPSKDKYEYCMNPCTQDPTSTLKCCSATGSGTGTCKAPGGCQQDWDNQNDYNVFQSACPSCLILNNCGTLDYHCTGTNGLTSYQVNFSDP